MTGQAKILTALAGAILAVGASSMAIGADYPQEWAGMDGSSLASLAEQFKAQGASATDQRKLLADYVTSRFLTDDAAAQSVNPGNWQTFTESLGPDMSASAREGWRVKLRSAFGAREMSASDLGVAQWVLALLDDKGLNEFAAGWAQHQDCWKSWPAEGLVTLGKCLGHGWPCEASVTAGRQTVAEHIIGTYLSSPEATLAVACANWPDLARFYGPAISSGQRDSWAEALRRAYASNEQSLRGRSAEQAACLTVATGELVGESQAALLALDWMRGRTSQEMSAAKPEHLEMLTRYAPLAAGVQEVQQLVGQLQPVWLSQHGQHLVNAANYYGIVRFCLRADDKTAAQQWAMRSYEALVGSEAARDAVSDEDLRYLNWILDEADLTGKGKGFQGFAQVLAKMATAGRLAHLPDDFPANVDAPLGDAPSRDTVKAVLLDDGGKVRQTVARILAWAYKATGESADWLAYLDGRIAAAGENGDLKARWLVARAYAESIVSARTPIYRSALRGKEWLDQAIACASSDECRLEVLGEVVDSYALSGRHDEASSLLDSLAGQFPQETCGTAIEAMRAGLNKGKSDLEASQAKEEADRDQRIAEARDQELRRRLAKAQAAGDARRAARIEAMLQR